LNFGKGESMQKIGVSVESVRREKGKIVAIRIRYRFEDGEVGYDLIFRPEGRNLQLHEKVIKCSIPKYAYDLMKKTAYGVLRAQEAEEKRAIENLKQIEFCFKKLS